MNDIRYLLLSVLTATCFAYETPNIIREKYNYLYSLPTQHNPNGSRTFHKGRLWRRDGLYVLSLEGDEFEMAFQHGRLLKEEIPKGALLQVAKIVDNSVINAFPKIPFLTDLIIKYLYRTDTDQILNFAILARGGDRDKFMLDAYGISEGAEIALDQVVHAAYGPESLQVILGKQMNKTHSTGDSIPQGMGINECTDFVARGTTTQKGGFIIGRNTDYPLNGFFDRFPTVIYFNPTDGAQKYMAVTSAGIHLAGIIGLNESGLYLGVHTIPTLEVSEKGNPIFVVGQEVLRYAKSFDEALEIFKRFKPAAGWAYTLVSTKENRMGSIEMTNHKIEVRESTGNFHIQTNHFLTPEMSPANLDLNASVNEDSRARKERTEELILSYEGKLRAEEAIAILSDKWDPVNKEIRGLANVISVHTTLSSAVFDLSEERVFVASGTAPVSQSPYIELPLINSFNPETFSSQTYSTIQNSSYTDNYPLIAEAEQYFIEAKTAFETELNPAGAYQILSKVIALDPKNAAYHFVQGMMALKAHDFFSAEISFKKCEELSYPHYKLLGHYYLGRIAANRGDKDDARHHLEKVLKEAEIELEIPLVNATLDSLDKLSSFRELKLRPDTLVLFMPEADMIKY
ncbi:MAG: C45 family autoproteolytic acyltransferase/hydrolase [Proteobacteria bacterium]|nr:C45 family autoproteolytic acyltransferase/hydrolase [Pseudomonadota bacterium]